MKVHVKLFAQLRKYHPGPNRSVPLVIVLPDYATPRDLVGRLELPPELVRNAFVNNEQRDLDAPLREGDQVALFSPVVGGAFSPLLEGEGLGMRSTPALA